MYYQMQTQARITYANLSRQIALFIYRDCARAETCARFRREQEPVNFVLFRVAKKKKTS